VIVLKIVVVNIFLFVLSMAWDVCDIDMDGEGDLESDRFTSMLHELFAVEDDPEMSANGMSQFI